MIIKALNRYDNYNIRKLTICAILYEPNYRKASLVKESQKINILAVENLTCVECPIV